MIKNEHRYLDSSDFVRINADEHDNPIVTDIQMPVPIDYERAVEMLRILTMYVAQGEVAIK